VGAARATGLGQPVQPERRRRRWPQRSAARAASTDRVRRLPGRARPAPCIRRSCRRHARRLGQAQGRTKALWPGADLIDEHISDQPVRRLRPNHSPGGQHDLPPGWSPRSTSTCAASAGDRLDEVIADIELVERSGRTARRADRPGSGLASARSCSRRALPDRRRRAARSDPGSLRHAACRDLRPCSTLSPCYRMVPGLRPADRPRRAARAAPAWPRATS
jgi:hypothetical protein